uniref:Shisa like 2A n=1 Tax=Astyanax mexicanus TaxID=7994 RepID=A0A8B9J434_ASTMX
MSADCTSYYSAENVFVSSFSCPKADGDARAIFCCGFNDVKYCCDDPNSFFPYEYSYMWWLSVGALVGLSIAAVVLLAFIITICVLCYLFIATKPRGLDNGLPLQVVEAKTAQTPPTCLRPPPPVLGTPTASASITTSPQPFKYHKITPIKHSKCKEKHWGL